MAISVHDEGDIVGEKKEEKDNETITNPRKNTKDEKDRKMGDGSAVQSIQEAKSAKWRMTRLTD